MTAAAFADRAVTAWGSLSTRRWTPLVAPLVTVVAAIVAQLVVGERSLNPDGASYLAIARHWADGDWAAAFNGYWSPLLSLILVPAAAVGLPLVPVAQAVMILTAGGAIAAVQHLMRVVGVDPRISLPLALGAGPFAVFAALANVTPDLLMAALLVVFVAGVVGESASPWTTGVVGGAAFLAKAYALPFVAAFLGVVVVTRGVAGRRSTDRLAPGVSRFVVMGAVAGGIALGWSLAVSVDAGRPTFSTASEYNREITAPDSRGDPYRWAGLIEPAEPSAFWGWEDPPEMLDTVERSGGDGEVTMPSDANRGRDGGSSWSSRLDSAVGNADEVLRSAALVAGSAIAAMFVVGWLAVSSAHPLTRSGARRARSDPSSGRRTAATRRRATFELVVAATIYVAGLLVLLVNARYLFFAMLVAVAIAGAGLGELASRSSKAMRIALVAALVVGLATAVRPAVAIIRLDRDAAEFDAIERLFAGVDVDGKRVASFPALLADVGSRCLTDDCVYLGAPQVGDGNDIGEQLDRFDVDLLVVREAVDIELPAGTEEVARSDDAGLVVYDVLGVRS